MIEPPGNDATRIPDDNLVDLVKLAKAGSDEAFAALFGYYRSGICMYVAGMVRSPEERDDLAQEIFVRAWEKLPQLRDASQFKPWLYRIATNLINDYGRRQKRKHRFKWLSLEECGEINSPESFEEHVIEEELVRQALKEVPWKYRTCLLLEIEGKLTRCEIAEVVGIHENSVSTYISNGRRHFLQAYDRLEKSVLPPKSGGQCDER